MLDFFPDSLDWPPSLNRYDPVAEPIWQRAMDSNGMLSANQVKQLIVRDAQLLITGACAISQQNVETTSTEWRMAVETVKSIRGSEREKTKIRALDAMDFKSRILKSAEQELEAICRVKKEMQDWRLIERYLMIALENHDEGEDDPSVPSHGELLVAMFFQRLVRKAENKAEELKAKTQDSFSNYMELNTNLRHVQSTPNLQFHMDSSRAQMTNCQDGYKAAISDLKALKSAAVAFCDFAQSRGQTRAVRFDRRMDSNLEQDQGFRAHTPHGTFILPDPALSPISPVSMWTMGERIIPPTSAYPRLRKKVSMRLASISTGLRMNDTDQGYSPLTERSNSRSPIPMSPQQRRVASPEPTRYQRPMSPQQRRLASPEPTQYQRPISPQQRRLASPEPTQYQRPISPELTRQQSVTSPEPGRRGLQKQASACSALTAQAPSAHRTHASYSSSDSQASTTRSPMSFGASRDTIVLSPEPSERRPKLRKKVSRRIISAGKEFVKGIERTGLQMAAVHHPYDLA